MPSLLFLCPTTHHDIPSYIDIDDASAKLVSQLPVTLSCPWCHRVHRMRVQDGHFSDKRDDLMASEIARSAC